VKKKYFHSVIWDNTVCLAASSSLPTPSLYLKAEGRFLKSEKKTGAIILDNIELGLIPNSDGPGLFMVRRMVHLPKICKAHLKRKVEQLEKVLILAIFFLFSSKKFLPILFKIQLLETSPQKQKEQRQKQLDVSFF
jgi:hypothetical protein